MGCYAVRFVGPEGWPVCREGPAIADSATVAAVAAALRASAGVERQ